VAVRALQGLQISPNKWYEIIKICIRTSCERDAQHREKTSQLIALLTQTPSFIQPEDVHRALKSLMEQVEDSMLDIPQFNQYLFNFVGRAILDEVLPPSFLVRYIVSDVIENENEIDIEVENVIDIEIEFLSFCIVSFCIVLYCIVLHCIALHCILLYCMELY
jgi:hypothetical protein